MATLPEEDVFPEGVYRIETTDPVVGGPPNEATGAGITNIPAMQLAKRTRWLKNRVDTLVATLLPATTAVAGIVRLNTATNSTSETDAATPSAVKAAMDNANTRAPASRQIATGGLATGGGTLAADRTISVPPASQAEAEDGVVDTKAMTPLRVSQAIARRVADGAVQAGSAILAAIGALASTGLIVRTGAGTVAARSLAAGPGVSVSNGDGVAGNPTVAIDPGAARVLIGGGAPDAVIVDQKATGTAAQVLAANAWTVRHLNTELRDPAGIVSVSGNAFTVSVDAFCEFASPCRGTGAYHQARLWNVTDGVVAGVGTSIYAHSLTHTVSVGSAALVAGKTYRLEHNASVAAEGGDPASRGLSEVFSRVNLWRL